MPFDNLPATRGNGVMVALDAVSVDMSPGALSIGDRGMEERMKVHQIIVHDLRL
ncbi:hypothetical protein LNQ03_10900 [Klebsiella pneumoniae subsp. pneumoniae]|nr:hypothetical protein [Klebsiella pneumoniae subsp. pneumoniae]